MRRAVEQVRGSPPGCAAARPARAAAAAPARAAQRAARRPRCAHRPARQLRRCSSGATARAQAQRLGRPAAAPCLQPQQVLAAEQHVAVEKRLGQRVVRVVRRTHPLVDVLRHEVALQQHRRDCRARGGCRCGRSAPAGCRSAPVTTRSLRRASASCRRVVDHAVQRREQRRLAVQLVGQRVEQPRQRMAHRLLRRQRAPQQREHAVPRGAGQQQRRFAPAGRRAGRWPGPAPIMVYTARISVAPAIVGSAR